MLKFHYTMVGQAFGGQDWKTEGDVQVEPGDFVDIAHQALLDTFEKLTQGKAVFGKPGVGCRGPYKIIEFNVRLVGDEDEQAAR